MRIRNDDEKMKTEGEKKETKNTKINSKNILKQKRGQNRIVNISNK